MTTEQLFGETGPHLRECSFKCLHTGNLFRVIIAGTAQTCSRELPAGMVERRFKSTFLTPVHATIGYECDSRKRNGDENQRDKNHTHPCIGHIPLPVKRKRQCFHLAGGFETRHVIGFVHGSHDKAVGRQLLAQPRHCRRVARNSVMAYKLASNLHIEYPAGLPY